MGILLGASLVMNGALAVLAMQAVRAHLRLLDEGYRQEAHRG